MYLCIRGQPNISFVDMPPGLVSKMTCYVSSGTFNPTHSLTHYYWYYLAVLQLRHVWLSPQTSCFVVPQNDVKFCQNFLSNIRSHRDGENNCSVCQQYIQAYLPVPHLSRCFIKRERERKISALDHWYVGPNMFFQSKLVDCFMCGHRLGNNQFLSGHMIQCQPTTFRQ